MSEFVFLAMAFAVLSPIFVLAAHLANGIYVGGRRYSSFTEFVEFVEAVTGLVGSMAPGSWPATLRALLFSGAIASGRRARIRYERHRAGKSHYHTVHLAVAVDPTVALEVARESTLHRVGAWLGLGDDLHTGDVAFDQAFWVQTALPARTRRAMECGLKDGIQSVFGSGRVERLAARGGWLELRAHANRVDTVEYPRLLEQLDACARAFSGPPEVSGAVRRGLGGGFRVVLDQHAATRCSLCHESVTPDEADLVTCDRCHTVLHSECWAELGRCPLLGCRGDRREQARVVG